MCGCRLPNLNSNSLDFIKRDPASYRPDLALADRQKLTLPWRGTPFWERPALARLGTVAQRLPMVFPPPKLNGRLLAGMGVWDVRGTEGTYFFYHYLPLSTIRRGRKRHDQRLGPKSGIRQGLRARLTAGLAL